MSNENDLYLPDSLTELVAAASGNASTAYRGMTIQRVARLPVHIAARVEAVKKLTGFSRNTVISEILDIGLQEFRRRLSPDVQLKYEDAESLELNLIMGVSQNTDLSDYELEKSE